MHQKLCVDGKVIFLIFLYFLQRIYLYEYVLFLQLQKIFQKYFKLTVSDLLIKYLLHDATTIIEFVILFNESLDLTHENILQKTFIL